MRVGRLVLVVATLVAVLLFPLMLRDAVQALKLPSAYAAPNTADAGGRVYQNGNNNDNDDDDDGGGNDDDDDDDNENNNESEDNENESGDNDNTVCYENLNSNEEVPCDFDDNDNYDDYDNDNYYAPPSPPSVSGPAPAPSSLPASRRCFAAGETGDVKLELSGGSVAIRVVSPGLPQGAWIELDDVDPASVPTPPGGATVLDSMVWRMDSGSGCDGGGAGQIVGDVNLGIPYHISANKSKLQIVRLEGGQWVEVNTVPDPDPNNPYISSTVRNTGIYAVIQKP